MNEFDEYIDSDEYLGEDEDTQKDRYLTFQIASEFYALDISSVTEIIGIQKITSIPDKRKYIKGIMNLRGNIIPVVDLRARFGFETVPYDERTCIVVVDLSNSLIGLIVDMVSEVVNIPEDLVQAAPKTNKGAQGLYLKGIGSVGNEVKQILSLEKLLRNDNLLIEEII